MTPLTKVAGFFLIALLTIPLLGAYGPTLEPADIFPCRWEPVGPGGGGGMFNPSFSPHDGGKVITMNCDMGGTFRSDDHGKSWEMLDLGLQGRPWGPLGYDPLDANVLFAVRVRTLFKSTDKGRSWSKVANVKGIGNGDFVVDPANPKMIWLPMTMQAVTPLFASHDGGDSWQESSRGIPDKIEVRGMHLDLSSPVGKRRLCAATGRGLYLSQDNGASWEKSPWFPQEEFVELAGYSTASRAPTLFAAVKNKGVYGSRDGGITWEPRGAGLPDNGTGCRLMAMPRTGDKVLFAVCGDSLLFRTDDGGNSWRRIHDAMKDMVDGCWVTKELGPKWAGYIVGLAVNPVNPDEIIFTDFMRACRTLDGGKSWHALHTRKIGDGWTTTGLGTSTCYRLYFDPKEPTRQYITYTDVGLFATADDGGSWRHSIAGVPKKNIWFNSCYELAIDPDNPRRIWGAFSRLHDLPLKMGTNHGGICVTHDGTLNWTPCTGLPEVAATGIVLDPSSKPTSRILYAGMFLDGVYKSSDGGGSWTKKSKGLPDKPPLWRLVRHQDGTLYCLLSLYARSMPGGLYVSTDDAETWKKIQVGDKFNWIMDVTVDPRSSKTIYLSGFSRHDDSVGGVLKSLDGGATWRRILSDGQIWGVTLDPGNPDLVYACAMSTGGGAPRRLLRSADGGNNWRRLGGLPFYNLHQVTVDPRNSRRLYVTTFGGDVWKTLLPEGID